MPLGGVDISLFIDCKASTSSNVVIIAIYSTKTATFPNCKASAAAAEYAKSETIWGSRK